MLKIGIVFSGALSKGAFHLGFVKAFKENLNGHKLKAVSGTSSGAVIAYAMATNQIEVLEELWNKANCSNAFSLWFKVVFGRLIKKYSKILIKEKDVVTIPLYITTFRLFPKFKFKYVKFEGSYTKSWTKAIEGSIGFPVVTGMPVLHKYSLYIDGGVVDNIPIKPLLKEKLDVLFVLHFDNKFNINIDDNYEVVIINLVLSTKSNMKLNSFNYKPEYINEMKKKGYEYSKEILERLLKHETIEAIREEAKIIVKEEYNIRKKIKTIDSIPTKFNKLFKNKKNKENNIISIRDF